MELGAFSVSINVKDIKKSYTFYQTLGFTPIGGNIEQQWIILKNGNTIIGLFENMLEKTTLTFNPGWSQEGTEINPFTDVRIIEKDLTHKGIIHQTFIEKPQGPGYLILEDPDGHAILIDQHR